MVSTYIRVAVMAGAGLLALTPAIAQQQSRDRAGENWTTNESVKSLMKDLANRADAVESKLNDALDRSSYNGTDMETHIQRWMDAVEDEIDEMAEEFGDGDNENFLRHFENTMMVAAAINRTMLRKDFAAPLQSEWSSLRDGLNHIATQLHRPVLPNVTVAVLTVAPASTMTKPDVKEVLTRLETHVDVFEDKYKRAVQMSTANMTDREKLYREWANGFEDAADDLLENFKENDASEFQRDLERTLLFAEMINRMMERSRMTDEVDQTWKVVRADLNQVATAYGYPIISGMIPSH